MIDTHAHLNDEAFIDDVDDVIKKCLENNVNRIIVAGVDRESNKKAIELAEKYECIYAAVGMHPEDIDKYDDKMMDDIEEMLKHPKVVAIGECGLDYYWRSDNKEKQKEIFKKQIDLSIKTNMPLIIHARDAIQDAYDLLKSVNKPLIGSMHGFSGSVEMAREFIKLGLKIGIGGVVTFKNAKSIKEVCKDIDISNILLETDCPYLTPTPFRGKRNDPSYLNLLALEISNIKNIEIEKVIEITTKNSFETFKKVK